MSQTDPIDVNGALPPLYQIADKRAIAAQSRHFGLVLLEYGVLISTATVTLLASFEWSQIPDYAYLASFVLLIIIATLSHFAGQDKSWFKARAAAEAIKTMAWRYIMRAPPFAADAADEAFLRRANSIAEIDRVISVRAKEDAKKSATEQMQAIRALSISDRAQLYLEARVKDQYDWYVRKSEDNANKSRRWYFSTCVVYIVPLVLIPAGALDGGQYWPIVSLFLLVGSSLLGWTKAKRFRELSTSYNQAAVEIRGILDEAESVASEQELTDLVFAAETAFSREHTSWIISKK